jgi:hypothetical protein
MPPHRRRACPICRVLDDTLPVDRYLALSAESFGCGCAGEEELDEDESDASPPDRIGVMRTWQLGVGDGRR